MANRDWVLIHTSNEMIFSTFGSIKQTVKQLEMCKMTQSDQKRRAGKEIGQMGKATIRLQPSKPGILQDQTQVIWKVSALFSLLDGSGFSAGNFDELLQQIF